ncbi:hypothetical protein AGMMS50255_2820 [Spirochaetia bacterium]|nr:hypothetical protein AGMMS50255_2820 [Spirochaetia bacterium]
MTVASGKVDKAVFWPLGSQIYACELFKDGILVGTMNDTHGAFLHLVKEHLEEKYTDIEIEVK